MLAKLEYQIHRTNTEEELMQVQRLRHIVLDPAKIAPTELDVSGKDRDSRNIIVAAFDEENQRAISTVRIDMLTKGGLYLVRKMATLAEYRHCGYGSKVLNTAEKLAIEQGATGFKLDSRKEAMKFYLNQGYIPTGEETLHNDGIPNFTMVKAL